MQATLWLDSDDARYVATYRATALSLNVTARDPFQPLVTSICQRPETLTHWPLLGALFHHQTAENKKRELVIFYYATIGQGSSTFRRVNRKMRPLVPTALTQGRN